MDAASTKHRYLAVWLPFLPTDRLRRQARLRGSPDDVAEPLVVAENVQGAMRLAAVSRGAMRVGLDVGLTLADARARIPAMTVVEHDPHADLRALEALADDCERFSPLVAVQAPDGLVLDITGCGHLFGGDAFNGDTFHGDKALKRELVLRFRRFGFHVRAALADTPDMARALARFARRVRRGASLQEIVRGLPIAALEAGEDVRIALSRAGLKTLADLADRPSLPLAARFGEKLTLRLRRVMGQASSALTPRRRVPVCVAEQRFAEPIARAEDVEATLTALGAEVAVQLGARREGGRLFEASFFRSDGAVRRIAVETGRPMRDVKALLRLFRERLDVLADPLDPGFGFDLIRLAVPDADPLEAAQTSLDGRVVEADEVAALVDRLSARFGRENVRRFVLNDTHDPERAASLKPAVETAPGAVVPVEAGEPPSRPLQMFDPPQPVSSIAEVPDGAPLSFNWRRVKHVVARAEGPERISPEWWLKPDAATRDYFRVEDTEGRRFWLFREGVYGRETNAPHWYVHGVFA